MPTPIDIFTKPLQLGAQITTRTIEEVVKRFTGGEQEEPPQPHQKLQREEQARQGQRPAGQRRQARPKPLDDVTITRKVESVLFREQGVDKGKISVNTTEGVVWLRGEAKTPEKIKELEAKTREIPEVKNVENLLHLPKTAPSAKKRRKAATAAASPRQRAPKRTTAERPASTPAAESTPAELAEKGEGRQPAPLGSTGSGDGSDSENGASS
jgi:HSP20 family molecular chaperone IbpA